MATFEKAVEGWTETINGWYGLEATPEEAAKAFRRYFEDRTFVDETDTEVSYVSVFFKAADGSWDDGLDTADREELADAVEALRGHDPLPTYADLGHGNWMNKAPRPEGSCCGRCGK